MHSSSTSKIQSVFRPRRWLRGGHLQTLAGNFLKRPNGLPEPEERLFQVEDDVQVLCHCHWQPDGSRQRTMTLMLVHGLEGSSNSGYVLGTGGKAWARGWNVVRMNIRNCGGTENLTPTLYHSGLSGDIRGVISTLIEQDNLQNVGVAGFSMGANQVLKCIGEWGSEAPKELVAAAAISPAADLSLSADVIHRPANRMYEWWFMRGLRARLRRKAALFPGKYDVSLLAKANSIRNFDEHITARYMGFEGAEDYYTKASSSRVLDRIAIPTLVIHADDDPFIKLSPETISRFESNPNIHFIYTEHGGHCAVLAEPNGYDGRWAENQIVDFLQARMKRSK
jgi:predicted alpha/beta-fold hydrolase